MTITGRVLYGPAAHPLARTWAVLHQVSMRGGGQPVDSARTDAQGAYSLTLGHPDSAAIYVVSSWHAGVAYFSEPIVPHGRSRETVRPLYVYDTSSTGPAVHVARRVVTIVKEKQDGTRDVLELVELENPGRATRVAPDTLHPTWVGAIPSAAIQFQAGQGDISAQAVTRLGDSVAVFGPIPPREPKQLSYAYVLPSDVLRMNVPIDQPSAEVDLLLEDTTATVTAGHLDSLGVEDIRGRRFARYRTPPLTAGTALTIAFSERRRLAPESLVPFVVALAALALAAGFAVALRRHPSRLASPSGMR